MTDDKPDVDGIRFETAAEAVQYAMDQGGGVTLYEPCTTGGEDRMWMPGDHDEFVPALIDGRPMVVNSETFAALTDAGRKPRLLAHATHPDGRTAVVSSGDGYKGTATWTPHKPWSWPLGVRVARQR
ncbi:MAG: hypothetical protein IH985_02530 [Planctomycetes bacterium]|nr:hypothetical protein [Planctomycetota bacterium]